MYFFRLERCNRRLSRTPSFTPRESIGQRATRTSNLSRGHRVIFPPGPRTERSRVGEVPATIAVHYAVHVAHVRQLAGDLHARHAHTRHAKSARDGICSLAHPTYAHRYTRPVSSDISSSPLSTSATAWRLEFTPRSKISFSRVMATRGRGREDSSWKYERANIFLL